MPRVIACSDSATITMQAHLHEGDQEKKTAFLLQFFSPRTHRQFLQYMQYSAQIMFFPIILQGQRASHFILFSHMKVSVTTEAKDRIFSFHSFHMSKYLEQILNKDWLQVIKFFENLSFSK
jgi:hypothetical protein